MKFEACKRCGICCKFETCKHGKKSKHGCAFLSFDENKTASCKLITSGKMPKRDISFGMGCVMKVSFPIQFEFYTELNKYSP